jgi:predicted ThiF/HesA family dinucleotide-utilizing enzyme
MMNYRNYLTQLVLVAVMAISAEAGAATVEQSGVAYEVNNCVAAVRENVDYLNAVRVRHDVTAIERRTVGYTLRISTALYDDNHERPIRTYAATCVVNGDNPPLSFSMERSR